MAHASAPRHVRLSGIWLTLGSRGRRLAERLLPVFQRPRFDTLQHVATADDASLGHGPHVVQQVQPSPLIHPNHAIPKHIQHSGLPSPAPPTSNIRHEPERPVSYNPVPNGVSGPQEALKGSTPRQDIQKSAPVQGSSLKTVDGPSSEPKLPAGETPALLAPAAPHGNGRWNGIINNVPQGHTPAASQPVAPPATVPTTTTTTTNLGESRPGPKDGTVPMGVGENKARPKPTITSVNQLLSNGDSIRYPDTLSSPSSTVQSALTPAGNEASTSTSPDNEASQSFEKPVLRPDQELSGVATDNKSTGQFAGPRVAAPELRPQPQQPGVYANGVPGVPVSSAPSVRPALSGAEAQLLQESAAARTSQAVGKAGIAMPNGVHSTGGLQSQHPSGVNGDVTNLMNGGIPVKHIAPPASASTGVAVAKSTLPDVAKQTPLPQGVGNKNNQGPFGPTPMDLDRAPATQAPKPIPSVHAVQAKAPVQEPSRQSQPLSTVPSTTPPSVQPTVPLEKTVPGIQISAPPETEAETETQARTSESAVADEESDMPPGLLTHQLKSLSTRLRERRRKSVPTVVFGQQYRKPRFSDDTALVTNKPKPPGHIPSEDYFVTLFIESFARTSSWMKPLEKLLHSAHKTVSTSDQFLSILDHQACKILRRVYHLQQHDKWSLRQPVRCLEPARPASHQDLLIKEMKWMRTDFREERKWKRAVARNFAYACAEWYYSSPADRKLLQVDAKIPPVRAADNVDITMADAPENGESSVPELDHSDSPVGNDEEVPELPITTIAPATIFALQDDEVVFELQPSRTADLLLENLPMYGSPLKVPKFDWIIPDYDPDAKWKRPAVPLSKYVEGEMVLDVKPQPQKRSRYQFKGEDEEEDEEYVFGAQPDKGAKLAPESTEVALFAPEMKLTRDRLHAGHQFRPPSEHPMPVQSFFESRIASQWTLAEDDQLRAMVREYSYNWSLISTMVRSRSLFPSAVERRTPWECFERWVNLEGLPSDFAKTPYFKAYQARIDAAGRSIQQHNQNAAQGQQVGPNGAVTPIPRKRPTNTMRVERRRNQKHLALFDAMRKLAKKREAAAQKQQAQASMTAMRKTNEQQRQQPQQQLHLQAKTPQEYSLMRAARDQQIAEKMAHLAARQHEIIQKRVSGRARFTSSSYFRCLQDVIIAAHAKTSSNGRHTRCRSGASNGSTNCRRQFAQQRRGQTQYPGSDGRNGPEARSRARSNAGSSRHSCCSRSTRCRWTCTTYSRRRSTSSSAPGHASGAA